MKGMVTSQRVHRTSKLIHSVTNRKAERGGERGRGGEGGGGGGGEERGRGGREREWGVKLVAFTNLHLLPSRLKRAFCYPRHKTTSDSYMQQQIHNLLIH